MSRLRLAVVGAGHLGRIHARLLSQQVNADLVAVVDPAVNRAREVAAECRAIAAADYEQIIGRVDAAIVAAPNALHANIGCDLLQHGIHVLMEKPLATTTAEADKLVNAARQSDRLLQVGHVERFNPAFVAAAPHLNNPKYIESRRTSGYPARSTDIGAVLDLMIHDIDLVLELAGGDVVDVQALGAAVLGGHEDMAQARLTFANGCVADLVASRVSFHAARQMNVYCRSAFASLDFSTPSAELVQPSEMVAEGLTMTPSIHQATLASQLYESLLQRATLPVALSNALAEEQTEFIDAIQTGTHPQVTGDAGRAAVAVADRILERIEQHQWNGNVAGPVGPHAVPATPILQPGHWADTPRKAA